MKKNKIFLLITLILLLLSVSYATEVSNDTTTHDDTQIKTIQTSTDTQTVEQNVIKEEPNNNEQINKRNEYKNVKESSQTINVANYDELVNKLDESLDYNYDTYIFNLKKGNYVVSEQVISYRYLGIPIIINGNGAILNGKQNIGPIIDNYGENNITIKNFTFTNFKTEYSGGAINNYGTLEITDCIFINNSADSYGGAIYNEGNITIKNSKFIGNNAEDGGAIKNDGGNTYDQGTRDNSNMIIINSEFINNQALIRGGAIYNTGNLTIQKSNFTNNKAESEYVSYGGALTNEAGNNININNNQFIGNTASHGSAISLQTKTHIVSTVVGQEWVPGHYENGREIYVYEYISGIQIGGHYEYEQNWVEGQYENIYEDKEKIFGCNITINKNIFIKNKATSTYLTKGAIEYSGKNSTIKNNINDKTSIYDSTISIAYDTQAVITNNTFDDGINYTKTAVLTTSGIIGEKLTLKATVTDTNNNKVNEGNLIFKLNGITIKDNGKLTGSSNPLKVKVTNGVATATVVPDLDMRNANKLTAKYVGTDNYNASESSQVKIQVSQRNASIVVSSNVKTIKQGQVLTITAKVYDTTNGKKSTNLTKFNEEFVYFKVNGITLKDSKGAMQKVKVVNGTATIKYTIPIGLSGVTDGKTFTVKNHTILAGFYNKNYKEDIRNTSTFQVERSNITITISNATVNNKTHKLSLNATIKDYLGNKVVGPNKCIIKVNGVTLKNGTQPIYYFASYGVLNIKNINIPSYNKYTSIEIVTQDRLAYKNQRNTTTTIKVTK